PIDLNERCKPSQLRRPVWQRPPNALSARLDGIRFSKSPPAYPLRIWFCPYQHAREGFSLSKSTSVLTCFEQADMSRDIAYSCRVRQATARPPSQKQLRKVWRYRFSSFATTRWSAAI